MAATKKIRYSISEAQQTAAWETGADVDYDESPPADDYVDAQAEYEEVADPDYDEAAHPDYDEAAQPEYEVTADPEYEAAVIDEEPERAAVDAAPVVESRTGFAYELGRAVLPLTQQQAYPVLWRGQLKERHPASGLLQRTNVYRLGDGYWDCYREEELRAA